MPAITPQSQATFPWTALPAAVPGSAVEIKGHTHLDVVTKVSVGAVTFRLALFGPDGEWWPHPDDWTVDPTDTTNFPDGRAIERPVIADCYSHAHLLIVSAGGGATVDAAFLEPVTREKR